MNIGKRDRQILLQAPAPVPQNSFGEPAPVVFADQGLEWARVDYLSQGAEAVQAAQQVATQPVQFTIRYRADVRPTWQVLYQGDPLRITAVTEIGRRQATLLTTQRRG